MAGVLRVTGCRLVSFRFARMVLCSSNTSFLAVWRGERDRDGCVLCVCDAGVGSAGMVGGCSAVNVSGVAHCIGATGLSHAGIKSGVGCSRFWNVQLSCPSVGASGLSGHIAYPETSGHTWAWYALDRRYVCSWVLVACVTGGSVMVTVIAKFG